MPQFKYRQRVLALLFLLSIITFIDRVCISLAGPRIQEDLNLSPEQWGWVMGAFSIAYTVLEIPSGTLGDRIGARKVLTRIVLWWSAFTSLTGVAASYVQLLPIRLLFGAGEAGAYPNMSSSISRWFPKGERARAHGVVWMGSRTGGAIAPLAIIPIQMRFGWRASFFCFGVLGVIWALIWHAWYRDSPADKPGISPEELDELPVPEPVLHQGLPWKTVIRHRNLWYISGMYMSYGYCTFFFVSWMPTYLVRGRGFSERGLLLGTLPFLLGALASYGGGFASDILVRRIGLQRGRRTVSMLGLGSAALFTALAIVCSNQYIGLLFLALSHAGSDLMLPVAWAVCLDVGRRHAGAVSSIMNTSGGIGGFFSTVLFGYIVQYANKLLPSVGITVHHGLRDYSYDVPLLLVIIMLTVSATLWLKIDPTHELVPDQPVSATQ